MNAEDIIIKDINWDNTYYDCTLAEHIDDCIATEDFSYYEFEIEENGYAWLMRNSILDWLASDGQVDLVDEEEAYRYYCERVAAINDLRLEYNRNNGDYRLYPNN